MRPNYVFLEELHSVRWEIINLETFLHIVLDGGLFRSKPQKYLRLASDQRVFKSLFMRLKKVVGDWEIVAQLFMGVGVAMAIAMEHPIQDILRMNKLTMSLSIRSLCMIGCNIIIVS